MIHIKLLEKLSKEEIIETSVQAVKEKPIIMLVQDINLKINVKSCSKFCRIKITSNHIAFLLFLNKNNESNIKWTPRNNVLPISVREPKKNWVPMVKNKSCDACVLYNLKLY